MFQLAREGALNNLSPGLGACAAPGVRKCHGSPRPRRRPLQKSRADQAFCGGRLRGHDRVPPPSGGL